MAIAFTKDQRRVIDLREKNILVSAAAGSGKTAVLTERIVTMVSSRERPVNIDRLLVVTFTNAAAAEMRERIGAAVLKRLEAEPDNEHLQRQATLIHNAQITTIDSFCMFVIRNNFNDIGLDPGFRIADEGELKLLKKDVMAAVMEEAYQKGEEAFLHCVEYFSTGNKDAALEEHVLRLYDFARSYPWPEEWLAARRLDYRLESMEELEASDMAAFAMEQARLLTEDCRRRLEECLALCSLPDGPYMYGEVLEKEIERIGRLTALACYRDGYAAYGAMTFDRLPSKKDDSVDPAKRELVQAIRKELKGVIGKITELYFPAPAERILTSMQGCEGAVLTLLDVTAAFARALEEAKREANILDFGDIEHFALLILVEKKEDGSCVPTRAALDYRAYFEEILIDEYQDSNLVQEYLLKSISGEETGRYNRFMVGDVKQSIYKFRLARPELFMEKYDSYGTEEGEKVRIDLHQNFRSRREVIDSVNDLFCRIMGKALGGVEYDDQAALVPGADYPPPPLENPSYYQTECLLVKQEKAEADDEAETLTARQKEAYAAAARIKELVGSFCITDSKTGEQKAAGYRDIVILLRTTSGWAEEFREVFKEEGIPAHVTSRTGYFAASEVQILLQLLRVLDNPLQDIPLFGVMKSGFGSFTEEELALFRSVPCQCVRTDGQSGAFLYDLVKAYAEPEGGEVTPLKEKAVGFLAFLTRWREQAVYMPVHELLPRILEESGYLHETAALPGGEQRLANVEILLEKAVAFGRTSYYGLFHFVRYIEQLEKYDVDYGEANTLDENADVVRIMSIHKSKGLEFPICFVCGMSKRFNMQDASGRLIADVDMGIGADFVDPVHRVLGRTLRKNVVAEKMKLDNLGEELRVLYVALTRAKEKLIITGVIDDEAALAGAMYSYKMANRERLPYGVLAAAGSYLDFLLPALAGHSCMDAVFAEAGYETGPPSARRAEEAGMRLQIVGTRERMEQALAEHVHAEDLRRKLERANALTDPDHHFAEALEEKFGYAYEHSGLAGLYTKTTVSELKKAGQKEEREEDAVLFEEVEVVPYVPAFMRQEEAIGEAGRGSCFHKVMELIDFTEAAEGAGDTDRGGWIRFVEERIRRLEEEGRLEHAQAEVVSAIPIAVFLESPLARRMGEAAKRGLLKKEQPFVLGISAEKLDDAFPKEETVLIQGIIDVYFEEDGELVVMDYKTDRVQSAGELADKYEKQLAYYAEALETLTGKSVKEKLIYSFGLGMEIVV